MGKRPENEERFDWIIVVHVDQLRPAPWNPPQRILPVNLRALVESMKQYGFRRASPITVTPDMMIIDGHRRWMAAKLAGIAKVPVYVDDSADPKDVYLTINRTIRPPSSREWLRCYLAAGKVPSRTAADIERIRRACGDTMLWRIAEANLSPRSLIQVGVSAIKYIGESSDDDVWLNRVIHWMVNGRRQWQVRAAIFYGRRVPIEELRRAIEEDRDVDLSKIEME